MSKQADVEEREDDLNLDDQDQADPPGDDDDQNDDVDGEQDSEDEGGDAGEEEELDVTFGEEAAPASSGDSSELVKQLRKQLRERTNQLNSLQRGEQPKKIELGPKPKLDDFYTAEGVDDPEAAFEQALESWHDTKRQVEAHQTEAQKRNEAVNAAFAEKISNFNRQRAELKVKDFEAAGEIVSGHLSEAQQMILVKVSDNAAALTYALGKHPQQLATIAAIEDPFEFTAALTKLGSTLKMTKRTRTPPPVDKPVRGSGQLSASSDKHLERLEREADRTGDRTAVVAYKRQLRAQGRS